MSVRHAALWVIASGLLCAPLAGHGQTPAQSPSDLPGFGDLGPAPVVAPQAPSTSADLDDEAAELARLVAYAERTVLSDTEADDARSIVDRLGFHRPVRRTITKILNMHHGFLDRIINAILLKRQWAQNGDLPNLSALTPNVIRGAEPTEAGFARLKSMGVTMIINLRMEDESETAVVSRLGMHYFSIPIPDTEAPNPLQARAFLGLTALARSTRKVYFHCAAGIFRTGTMAALYRIAHGMKIDDALAEARTFGWSEGWLDADEEAAFLRQWAKDHTGNPLLRLLPRLFGRTPSGESPPESSPTEGGPTKASPTEASPAERSPTGDGP